MLHTWRGLSQEQWSDIARAYGLSGEQARKRFIRYGDIGRGTAAGGGIYVKAGSLVAGALVSGGDVSTHAETGALAAGGRLSGTKTGAAVGPPALLVEIAFGSDPFASRLVPVFTLDAVGAGANHWLYVDMSAVDDYTIQPGDVFEYDIYWPGATQWVAPELEGAAGAFQLRNLGATDQNGVSSSPATDLTARANGVWYHRQIPLTATSNVPGATPPSTDGSGVTITNFMLAMHHNSAGALAQETGTAYLRDIVITNGGRIVKRIWGQVDGPPTAPSLLVVYNNPGGGNVMSSLTKQAPLETIVWTDVTAYVLELHTRRGRQREAALDQIAAGTLTLALDNKDRRFDPSNSSSPYYPNVLPMRAVRVRAFKNGVEYRRYKGFIERWPPTWTGKFSEVSLDCVDGFEPLQTSEISGFRAVEQSGARIQWALDQAGWPTSDRNIDPGNSQVEQSGSATGTLLDNADALSHIQDIEKAELGAFFIAGDGKATFQQRQRRLTAPYNVSQGVFSNSPGPGEFLYLDPQPAYDKDDIYNDIRSRPVAASTDSIAEDLPSQVTNGPRTLSEQVWLTTLTECLNRSQYLLARYKQPSLRIDGIQLEPLRQEALWAQLLARELGDRITVEFAPYGGGPTVTRDVYIESIAEDIVAREGKLSWSAQWSLSPADVQAYWILGDANLSLLGQSTVLAY